MSGKITQHPTVRLMQAVRNFRKKPTAKSLLGAVHLAAEFGLPSDIIRDAYREVGGDLWSLEVADELARFLSVLPVRILKIGTEEKITKPLISSDAIDEAENFLDADKNSLSAPKAISSLSIGARCHVITKGAEKQEIWSQDEENPYRGFKEMFGIIFPFDKYFPEKDPALVISNYLLAMDSADGTDVQSVGSSILDSVNPGVVFVRDILVVDCARHLLAGALAAINSSAELKDGVEKFGTSTRESTSEGTEDEAAAGDGDDGSCKQEYIFSISTAKILLLSVGDCSSYELDDDLNTENCEDNPAVRSYVVDLLAVSQEVLDFHFKLMKVEDNRFCCRKTLALHVALLDDGIMLDTERRRQIEFLLPEIVLPERPLRVLKWEYMKNLLRDHLESAGDGGELDGLWDLYELFVEKADSMGRNSIGGRFPISIDELGNMLFDWQDVSGWYDDKNYRIKNEELLLNIERDIRVSIAYCLSAAQAFLGIEPYESHDIGRNVRSYDCMNDRSRRFSQISDVARCNGLEELSCAILAFGLVTQSLMAFASKQSLQWDSGLLSGRMKALKGAPGSSMILRAVELGAQAIEERLPRSLDALWLRSLAVNHADFDSPLEYRRASLAQIEASLIESVGSSAWLRLTASAKSMLKDAEIQFSRCHLDVGSSIKNHGAMAMAYFNALEFELVSQVHEVFESESYTEYQRSSGRREKPTLGTVIHLVGNLEKLPRPLSEILTSNGRSWIGNAVAARLLLKIVRYRNEAAHAKNFSAGDFVSIRRILFQDGLLRLLGA